jgi:hypothetical protein
MMPATNPNLKDNKCPAGRPLYRQTPVHERPGLATKTELRQLHRRNLAAGQEPEASLLTRDGTAKWIYVPLYRIEAATPMRPMTERQQARHAARRTCARCGATQQDPYPRAAARTEAPTTGRRMCQGCIEAEAEASWWADANRRRGAAVQWAREVLQDPTAVILAQQGVPALPGVMYRAVMAVEVVSGHKLIDTTIIRALDVPIVDSWREHHTDQGPPALRPAEAEDQVRQLVGRRLVTFYPTAVASLAHTMGWDDGELPEPPADPWAAAGNVIARRAADWWAQHPGGMYAHRRGYLDYPREMRPSRDNVADEAAGIRHLLQLLAEDNHRDGPMRCPTMGATGLDMCRQEVAGAGPFCGRHRALYLPRTWTRVEGDPGAVEWEAPQRACNGCRGHLGDATTGEVAAGALGQDLPDVTAECPHCRSEREAGTGG